MKKRLIISIAVIFGIASALLLFSVLQLYKEAEKVQRSIFTSEVLTAGSEVIDKIDALLLGDTLSITETAESKHDTTSPVAFKKYAQKFLLDPSRMSPIGVIRTTISYMRNDVVLTKIDTTYFDTTYKKIFMLSKSQWENDFSKENMKNIVPSVSVKSTKDIDLIEMDSNTRKLLNYDYLNRIIKEALVDQNINGSYDFALYNSFTANFVVSPHHITPQKMLSSEYNFSLKSSDRFITPHYLIISFMNERSIFFQRMSLITILIALFFVIVVTIVIYIFRMLFRQKRIAEVKNDFINNITHEFKTPISTITLACEALNDNELLSNNEMRSSYISIISDENARLKKMVDNILQLAQLKKGQLQISIEKFDLHELINHVCDIFSLQISTRHGELVKHLDATDSVIFADITHFENVLINIMENAVKYSKGKPYIEISTVNDKKNIVISITDHGIGIGKNNLRKIFEDFYRESSGNVHNTQGHGLGLFYVKKIINLHGGSIVVKSEVNQGSIFIITLPLKNLEL